MKKLKLKVCGMRDADNIQKLVALKPDFIGFVFYPKSPRYVDEIMDDDFMMKIPSSIHKVGVFVNESIEKIVELARRYGLDYIQLHGDEDLIFAQQLKEKGLKIIKVFRVMDTIPFIDKEYEKIVDYFLFDTLVADYGGSGHTFNWDMLKDYTLNVPFMLSGGVELVHIPSIKSMNIKQLIGVDVNSRFEIVPALKDIDKLRELKMKL